MAQRREIEFDLSSFRDFEAKAQDTSKIGVPLWRMIRKLIFSGSSMTKENMPVDVGRALNSVVEEFGGGEVPEWGKWGSNLDYMPSLEEGSEPHWPPQGALQPWAGRHGFDKGPDGDFLARRAISQRGTPAHHMFASGAEVVGKMLPTELGKAAEEIVQNFAETEI